MASSAGISKEMADTLAEKMAETIGDIKGVPVTKGQATFEQVRNMITQLLAGADYDAYKKYRAMKYGDFEPTLEQRKAAYKFAFETLLDKVYTASHA